MPEESTQYETGAEESHEETHEAEKIRVEEAVFEEMATKEERFLAGLAHFCIVAVLPIVIAPLLMWLTEKDKPARSEYILHHAKQAVLFQVLLLGAVVVLSATVVLSPVAFILGLAGVVYGVVGGILACVGKKFNYLWIGNYVEQWSR